MKRIVPKSLEIPWSHSFLGVWSKSIMLCGWGISFYKRFSRNVLTANYFHCMELFHRRGGLGMGMPNFGHTQHSHTEPAPCTVVQRSRKDDTYLRILADSKSKTPSSHHAEEVGMVAPYLFMGLGQSRNFCYCLWANWYLSFSHAISRPTESTTM